MTVCLDEQLASVVNVNKLYGSDHKRARRRPLLSERNTSVRQPQGLTPYLIPPSLPGPATLSSVFMPVQLEHTYAATPLDSVGDNHNTRHPYFHPNQDIQQAENKKRASPTQ